MLKKLQICFLGLLCLFPNRSRTITRHLKNYLSDKGAVFRQPQADISQKRSDFISQAEGLCISNYLNQKWFVKTFLILSILLSSINEVNSQVACSPPGIELVDNPGIPALAGFHRSGETRSDTFYSVTAQDIDGGPGIEASIQSQSVSYEFQHQTAILDRYSKVNESAVDCGPSTVDCSPIAIGLKAVDCKLMTVDYIGEAYIYGELISSNPLDSVYITSWNHFLDENQQNPLPLKQQSGLRSGNLFEGSYGKQVFEFSIPMDDSISIFSLRLDQQYILKNYLLEAGDSVKVLIDLKAGQVLFAGEKGPKYQAQHLIYQSLEASRQDQDPVMVSSPSGKEKMISRYPEMYQKAQETSSSLKKSLRFILDRADSLSLLANRTVNDPFMHPAWSLLASQKFVLGEQFAAILPSRIIGMQLLPFFRSAKAYSELGRQVEELTQQQTTYLLEAKKRFGWNALAPELLEILLLERYLKAYREGNKLFFQYDQLEEPIRDRLYGKYLTSNIEHRAISPDAFAHAKDQVKSPWILNLIQDMEKHLVAGADLSDYSFTDKAGNQVDLDQFEGHLVLLNFWLSGCIYSQYEFENVIHPTEIYFRDDPRVIFLSVSADPKRSHWQHTLEVGDFTSEFSLPVYAGPDHAMIRDMGIHSYPRKLLLDSNGQLIAFQELPRNADSLIQLIRDSLEKITPHQATQTK